MAIDDVSAREYLTAYLNDLEALRSGVPYSEIGISKRRASSLPTLIFLDSKGDTINADFTQENIAARPGQFAHLHLKGAMRMDGGISGGGVMSLVEDMRAANASPNISGILLEVNSGGGEVGAGNAVYSAMRGSQKPVVALVHKAGSAAMLAIAPASKRIATGPFSELGSIGVYSTMDAAMVQYYKENYKDIYAEQSPDKNKGFRELLEGSTNAIQRSVNKTADIFQKVVSEHLNLNENLKESTLAGGMFMAADAKKRGLLDDIGTFQTAITALQSEVETAKQVTKTAKDMGFFSKLIGETVANVPDVDASEQPSMDDLTATIQAIGERIAQSETATANATAIIATMQTEISAATAQIAGLKTAIENTSAENAALQTENTALKESIAALSASLSEVEGIVANKAATPLVGKTTGSPLTEPEKTFKKSFRALCGE